MEDSGESNNYELVENEDDLKMECEYCGQSYENNLNLLFCYSRHFESDLVTMCGDLLEKSENNQSVECPFCSLQSFDNNQQLALHIGSIHLLVNDILIKEGIYPRIPRQEEFEEYFDEIEE